MMKAKLAMKNGVPAICVNGAFREAHMLYLRSPAGPGAPEYGLFFREAGRAAASGVHFFTFDIVPDAAPAPSPGAANGWALELMRGLVKTDPQAVLLPRCMFDTRLSVCGLPEAEAAKFTDGRGMECDRSSFEEYAADPSCFSREGNKHPFADLASDCWRKLAELQLIRFIRGCLADPVLAEHVAGYHPAAGMTGENYQFRYWDGVLDVSEANQLGFRAYLRRRYRTDAALSAAWEQDAALDAVRVPGDMPGLRRTFRPEIRERARRDRRTFDAMEWYTWRRWDALLDQPDAMNYSFRVWLDGIYHTDEALSRAWGGSYSLSDRLVPADFADWLEKSSCSALFAGTGRRRFIDYLDYCSDQTASFIESMSAAVKRETGGDSLTCFFYGYHYDVPSAQSGHHGLCRLLKDPDVDILCSPVSYYNRNEGGMGAYMTDAASVQSAGKLWLDECDYRQPVVTGTPDGMDVCMSIRSAAGAREVILRQCGKLALYGAAAWWMDLRGLGWYDSDGMWQAVAEGRALQRRMEEARRPSPAEVVLLDEEESMSLVEDDWGFADDLMTGTRNGMYFSGLSFDFRTLEDFLSGKTDGAKLYVFLNPFRLIGSGLGGAVLEKLRENGAAALWVYGFAPDDDPAAVRALTGFRLSVRDGSSDCIDVRGRRYPRRAGGPLVIPENGTVLGVYSTGEPAFAAAETEGRASYFWGGSSACADIVRTAAAASGAMLHAQPGDMFCMAGNLAVLHTATAGKKVLSFRAGKVTELRSGRSFGGTFTLDAPAFTTYLFLLS